VEVEANRMAPLRIAVVGLAAALLAFPQADTHASPQIASTSGLIAFEAAAGLYVMDADGGEPRRIPSSLPGDGNPVWAPDGRTLSFERRRHGNWDVWMMNADGSDQQQLTFSPADDDFARWAPHGRTLVFQSDRRGRTGVYAMSLRTREARRVTPDGGFPDWAPDGRIVFTTDKGEIFTVRPYGAERRPLRTQPPGAVVAALVSNDGSRIVYNQLGDDGLFTARIDGSQRRRVTNPSIEDDNPAWSPDDRWIVFHRGVTVSEVYIVRVNGSQETRLTSLGSACCPDWKAPG
jgi:Tol biopolymer transport system component